MGALVLSTLSTIRDFEPLMTNTVMYIEPILLLWLVVEYSVRIWASGCRSRYQGYQGRLKFAQRPLCIVDAVIILSTLLVILVGSTADRFAASTLRGLRFFQILRMVRMDRRAGTWKLLGSVVWAHRRELLTTLYIGFLGLLFSSYLVYLAEKDYNKHKFGTYADALWWGVVTLCTVGYGDVVPETWAGKLIASFSAILGIAFFALPAGILGSGFALKVQQQQRQKHLIRRRVPAALLIQSLWRCYAADEHSISIATWKPHMIPCPSPTTERPFKQNASFVSRFSTRRKDRGSVNSNSNNNNSGNVSPHSPMVPRRERNKLGSYSEDDVPDTIQRSHLSLATGLVDQRVDRIAMLKDTSLQSVFCSKQEQSEDESDLSPKIRDLTDTDKKAIRSLRKIKYFVARKKFREALRPYDVKDVIEQYSAGHVDMLSRVKSLQCRLDQILGKSGSKNKDVYESKVSLSSRIVKVERQVEDIESKLDLLIDLYKDDRKILLNPNHSSSTPERSPNGIDSHHPKPRSILIDKQHASEPSSPITEKHDKKVIMRNHSDLSSRMRKRVTYKLQSAPFKNKISHDGFGRSEKSPKELPINELSPLYTIKSNSTENEPSDLKEICNASINEQRTGNDTLENTTDGAEHSLENDDKNVNNENVGNLLIEHNTETESKDIEEGNSASILPAVSMCNSIGHDIEKSQTECLIDIGECDNSEDLTTKTYVPVCNSDQSREHVVLVPLGSMQALAADSSDV
ncbi:potassium voltage-gated channel subfamily KQT member 5-like isoform X2 [Ruditapes philippinarum]|uniref:potassium voltage-gated channel subfamily KQT member 5-like isoform X2 n=1 Tax=Ruditapes philippinarum TaxID=129788 RepID=UPI00295C0B54|nr:potassium voltage-gated channel subfamily KQT member 5-like isoform X2 [Ruditapes philippinarum]